MSRLIDVALKFLGVREGSEAHKGIVDTYNAFRPLPRGYAVKYTDSWCAVFVSVCGILAGVSVPVECGCQEMFNLFPTTKGRDYIPKTGDIVFYDWNGDGHTEHVGIVQSCDGKTVTVIEGNHNDEVGTRSFPVGWGSVYGYGVINMNVKEVLWNKLFAWIGNPYGVAGLMGNIRAESAYRSNNLQDRFNSSLKMTDEGYTNAVDDGSYTKFINDGAGYGLCQWTYWSRKKKLLEFAKNRKTSIGDLDMQIDFLMKEITENYPDLLNVLKTAQTIRDASNAVLFTYERPADQGQKVQDLRCSYGEEAFNGMIDMLKEEEGIDPASFLEAIGKFVMKCKEEGWKYGDSHSWSDKLTACDRMVSKTLYYYFGITEQPEGGWDSKELAQHLPDIGFEKITDQSELQAGDIVFMDRLINGKWDVINHTMVIVDYDPATQMCHKYDHGEQWRIDAEQPFYCPLNQWGADRKFGRAYRAKGRKKSKVDIIRAGQEHSIEFTGHSIKVDGDAGDETRKQKYRVLRHAMNLDYFKDEKIPEDTEGVTALLKKCIEGHYVELGEKQSMVCALEILLELNGVDPNGVEIPVGEFGSGLQKAVGKKKVDAQYFLQLCE